MEPKKGCKGRWWICWGGHWAPQQSIKLFAGWLLPWWVCFLPLNVWNPALKGGNLVAKSFNYLIVALMQSKSQISPLDFAKIFLIFIPPVRKWNREQINTYIKMVGFWNCLTHSGNGFYVCLCVVSFLFLPSFYQPLCIECFIADICSSFRSFWWILAAAAVWPCRKTRVSNDKINFPLCCSFTSLLLLLWFDPRLCSSEFAPAPLQKMESDSQGNKKIKKTIQSPWFCVFLRLMIGAHQEPGFEAEIFL